MDNGAYEKVQTTKNAAIANNTNRNKQDYEYALHFWTYCLEEADKNTDQFKFLLNQVTSYKAITDGVVSGENKYTAFSEKDIAAILK